VPITDLTLKDNDLIVATQGRSFWILDDLSPLHQAGTSLAEEEMHLFTPRPAIRMSGGGGGRNSRTNGQNRPAGVFVYYYLKEAPAPRTKESAPKIPAAETDQEPLELVLEILEADGTTIRRFSSRAEKREDKLEPKDGLNRFVWDMRYPAWEDFKGMIVWNRFKVGPAAVPGEYRVRLTLGENRQEQPFRIIKDPRVETDRDGFQAQFDFLISCRDKLTETHQTISRIREIRGQIKQALKPVAGKEEFHQIRETAAKIQETLISIEETLYQTKNRSAQDPLNFPIRLNDKLAGLMMVAGIGDNPPTAQALEVRNELFAAIDRELERFQQLLKNEIPDFNLMITRDKVPAVWISDDKK
jgi:hypothetical protein